MAGENNRADILVIDNKLRDRAGYINLLKSKNLSLDIISDLMDRERIYLTTAKVFIIAYTLGYKDGSDAVRIIEERDIRNAQKGFLFDAITGLDIAENLRLAEKDIKYYIHIVSSETRKEFPSSDSILTWNEWVEKGTINSYSTRDVDEFVDYLTNLVNAVAERKKVY